MNKYYLPISSENLGHYFAAACICPTRYISNRNTDIQNRFDNYLLLSSKKAIEDSDCSLEIVLTDIDIKDCKPLLNDCWLLNKPLPITRVKKVLFANSELMEHTITNIEINTAYIPKIFDKESFDKAEIAENTINSSTKDWDDEIKSFNQILGGLSLMRLVTKGNMNYSDNYFSKLASYNSVIEQELIKNKIYIKNLFESDYYSIVNKYIKETINQEILAKVAKEEKQKITKKLGVTEIDTLDKASYIIAILHEYKVTDFDSGRKNIDTLILNRFSTLKSNKGEEVAFYYGFNRGYKIFSKKYNDIEFKYRLDSMLDYYTIESVYQKAFNNIKKSNKFIYLDDWCPNKFKEIESKSISLPKYKILDSIVVGSDILINKKKPKVGSKEYWKSLFSIFLEKIKKTLSEEGENGIKKSIVELGSQIISDKNEEFEIKERKFENTSIVNEDTINYDNNKVIELEKEINQLKIQIENKGVRPKKKESNKFDGYIPFKYD